MKLRSVSVLAAALAALTACQSVPETQSGQPSITDSARYEGAMVRRWSPIVSDMDRAIRLYRDILGFELDSLSVDPPDSYVFEIFDIDRSISVFLELTNRPQKVAQDRVLLKEFRGQRPRMALDIGITRFSPHLERQQFL